MYQYYVQFSGVGISNGGMMVVASCSATATTMVQAMYPGSHVTCVRQVGDRLPNY